MKSTLERFLLALACNVNPACCYFMPAVYPAWGPRVKALHEFIYFWWEITTVLEGDNIFIPAIFRGMSLIAQNLIWFRWNKHLAIYQKRTKILAAAWWDFLLLNHLKKKKKTLLLARSCRSYTIQTKSKKGKKTKQKKTLPRGPQKHTPLLIKHGHAQVLHHTDGISGWWFGIMSPLAALANPFCWLLGDNSVVPKGFSETA